MKQRILLRPTKTTPRVAIDYPNGIVRISGRSSPEDTLGFYNKIFKAIAYFRKTNTQKITVSFKYIYFNTSTARCIFMIIKVLKELSNMGKEVYVNWFVDENDEDMIETGEDIHAIVDIPFTIRKISKK